MSSSISQWLVATDFFDLEHPLVQSLAVDVAEGCRSDAEKASAVFAAVRDRIRYNPYRFSWAPADFKASAVIAAGEGYCVPKAIVLTAVARAAGIPARIGFADVRNHLSSQRLLSLMKTDIFAFHGYAELFVGNRWLKATPAFNTSLCDRFGVPPLEFDGEHDAIFHAFDGQGRRFMEYVRDHGTFADFPFERMVEVFRQTYPHWFDYTDFATSGSLEEDLAREQPN